VRIWKLETYQPTSIDVNDTVIVIAEYPSEARQLVYEQTKDEVWLNDENGSSCDELLYAGVQPEIVIFGHSNVVVGSKIPDMPDEMCETDR
jgi:hypothetical protein